MLRGRLCKENKHVCSVVKCYKTIELAARKQLQWVWVVLVIEQNSLQTVLCNLGNYNVNEQLLIFANLKCT